jgi:hypothetical protein
VNSDDGGRRSSPRPIFRSTSRLATFTLSDPDGAVDALVGRRADRDPVSRGAGGRRDPSVSGSRPASSGAGTVRRGPSRRHGRDRGSRVPGTQVDQPSGQDRLAQLLFHASAAVSQQRSPLPRVVTDYPLAANVAYTRLPSRRQPTLAGQAHGGGVARWQQRHGAGLPPARPPAPATPARPHGHRRRPGLSATRCCCWSATSPTASWSWASAPAEVNVGKDQIQQFSPSLYP